MVIVWAEVAEVNFKKKKKILYRIFYVVLDAKYYRPPSE